MVAFLDVEPANTGSSHAGQFGDLRPKIVFYHGLGNICYQWLRGQVLNVVKLSLAGDMAVLPLA